MRVIRNFFLLLIAAAFFTAPVLAQSKPDKVLNSFFTALNDSDYVKVWSLLTDKSQNYIVKDFDNSVSEESLKEMFAAGKSSEVRQYWSKYASLINAAKLAELDFYSAGSDFTVQSILSHKKFIVLTDAFSRRIGYGDKENLFCMCQENGEWKVGLTEMKELMDAKAESKKRGGSLFDDIFGKHSESDRAGNNGRRGMEFGSSQANSRDSSSALLGRASNSEAAAKPAGQSKGVSQPVPQSEAISSLNADNYKVGSYVKFGRYPQSNAKTLEPIEWKVLENDGKTALLISRYGLDCKPFHNTDASVTWRNCDLRQWLNTHFISKAFTQTERQRISETIDSESANNVVKGNSATRDEVFLLSADEVVEYLIRAKEDSFDWDGDILKTHDFALSCRPTAYAVSRGVKTVANSKEFRNAIGISNQAREQWFDNCCYWLRSNSTDDPSDVFCIFCNGALSPVDHINSRDDYIAVRPALRIKLK